MATSRARASCTTSSIILSLKEVAVRGRHRSLPERSGISYGSIPDQAAHRPHDSLRATGGGTDSQGAGDR